MNEPERPAEATSIGIVGGNRELAARLSDALETLGYTVAFALPGHRPFEERTGADGVIVIPAEGSRSLTVAIDGEGGVRVYYVPPDGAGGQDRVPTLTNREKQTLGLVIMGLSNQQIAQKLFISESTVKSHLNSAYRKLGVRSRAEAARVITDPATGFGTGILAITGPGLERGRTRKG